MVYVGAKYYKYIGEETEVIRVMKFKNDEIVVTQNDKTNEISNMDINTLENNYILITFDGLLMISKVNVGGNKEDVIVSLYRRKEIENKDGLPYLVCRQGITDLHAQPFTEGTGKNYYGASISRDTIPAGIDFGIMVACDSVVKDSTQVVAIYLNDTFDSILNLIKTEKYDNTLNLLFLDHLQFVSQKYGQMYYKTKLQSGECEGYYSSLRDLLYYNNFMYDFYIGFNVYPLNYTLTDQSPIPDDCRTDLSNLLCKNIDNTFAMKYYYDIALGSIQKEYILVSDMEQNVYVVVYTHSGIYEVPVENTETAEGIANMNSRMKSNSVAKAYNHICFNKDKYL